MIDEGLIERDLLAVRRRWDVYGLQQGTDMGRAIGEAVAAVMGRDKAADGTARICVMTKSPHVRDLTAVASIAARLIASGAEIHAVRKLAGRGSAVARVLYPSATRQFEALPGNASLWEALDRRFGNDEFTSIFGERYTREMVVPGAEAARSNGLDPTELTEIWESGRFPTSRAELNRRYGPRAAELVTGGAETYDWFRGPLPLGISRIAPALTAFAMRHERLNCGAPIIVLNGHVPGLVALYESAAWVLDVGLEPGRTALSDVRRHVTGDDNRPEKCLPGTLRRDAYDGHLPVDTKTPVSSRYNVVHCSDGLLNGLREIRDLIPDRRSEPEEITSRLVGEGLTPTEIEDIVLADPVVVSAGAERKLSDLTAGLDVAQCVAEVVRLVPPVFGPANGYADGVAPALLGSLAKVAGESVNPDHPVSRAPLVAAHTFTSFVEFDAEAMMAGREALGTAKVGVVAPAGGTGGRFGGYDVPETDFRRQKAINPLFEFDGQPCSSLDIRLANARHWSRGPRPVPFAVMASQTSFDALRSWQASQADPYAESVIIFQQHGLYRLDEARIRADQHGRWIDMILRDASGRPRLKPPGTLGIATAFVLSGLLERWRRNGVEYIAIANGDDVGFRLDPRAVGHLVSHPELDALVAAAPWSYVGKVLRNGEQVLVRGDESGWMIDERGQVVRTSAPPDAEFDTGGALFLDERGEVTIREMTGERPPEAMYNTNQMYVRLSSLEGALGIRDTLGTPDMVRRFRERQSLVTETKDVQVDGTLHRAWQVAQPLHGLLERFGRVGVLRACRVPGEVACAVHAPLKRRSDARFGQLILERMYEIGDELDFGKR